MKWDLDRIKPKGLPEIEVKKALNEVDQRLATFVVDRNTAKEEGIIQNVLEAQDIYQEWYQLFEYVICLHSIDTTNDDAAVWLHSVNEVYSRYQMLETTLDQLFASASERDWGAVLQDRRVRDIEVLLDRRRHQQLQLNNDSIEAAMKSLQADGLHAWGEMNQLAASKVSITLNEKEVKAQNVPALIYYGADREIRLKGFEQWKTAWEREAPICAKAMNHIAGFRLSQYKARGWDSYLKESLDANRLTEETLDAMWQAVLENRQPFYDYIKQKKDLFQATELSWTDQFAPLALEQQGKVVPFKEGVAFIENHLHSFDPKLAEFTRQIIKDHWVDSQPSELKSPGAFCAPMPINKESRIFMHYHENLESVGVLAHEIGHAYHYRLLQELPMYRQDCPIVMAELASTLTETIVMRAAIEAATDPMEKLNLLNQQLVRDLVTILNSYIRHQFEVKLYEKRKSGFVKASELNQLMEDVQKEVMGDLFNTYDPTFWASLRHFYFTHKPFGHYPYTIAHLLSIGFYTVLEKTDRPGVLFDEILIDASILSVEELVEKHTGMDPTSSEFWALSLEKVFDDIKLFIEISDGVKKGEANK
ncbi:M3 family oligoendopeptidase [Alkalihalophilus lindianensis]|uniref:M3 family oligoendopeptidase n=1 Tax=Alkalihalophilus lindianensis TaxID=1630542 RepID=A0ABU3X546_9BACI|nr:M3 family oligoendopeptidase [Alkalihalophilus lindianensis]MDV2683020.1 M3 family oligoendopeptidase [Alkalihalophilus lindianensis]